MVAATGWRPGEKVWDELGARSLEILGEFNPQDLANTTWAFATVGREAPALFDAVAAEAAPRLREFKPQAKGTYLSGLHALHALQSLEFGEYLICTQTVYLKLRTLYVLRQTVHVAAKYYSKRYSEYLVRYSPPKGFGYTTRVNTV